MSPDVVGIPDTRPGQDTYIVLLRRGAEKASTLAPTMAARYGGIVRYTFRSVINGFSIRLPANAVNALRADPNVQLLEPDAVVYADDIEGSATWGLDRLDQRALPLNSQYQYMRTGRGVSVYIVDTGIRYSHTEFGGRATLGIDAVGGDGSDCNGHGTHVAATVGGRVYGVAKAVALRSVRVLNCSGAGSYSTVIAGLDWIATYAALPAVVNMSLGGPASATLDSAVAAIVRAGITVAVAAGNSNADACDFSPARTPDAITVGAADQTDTRASFSNFGSCVDLFAPGVGITSATYTADDATATLSGTSMASPHTAGVAALYLEAHPAATPGEVEGALATSATHGIVKSANSVHNDLLFALGDTAGTGSGAPAALFSVACGGAICQFTDKSSDANGLVAKWQWDFGDGATSQVRNASHDFVWNGTYRVTLVVTDDNGLIGAYSTPLTVTGGQTPNKLPSADFVTKCADRSCLFSDASTDIDGSIVGWQWDYGDGTTSSGSRLGNRYYAAPGTYSVKLTVTDDRGGSDSQVYSINVGIATNAAPVAAFGASCTGLTCAFTDQSTDGDGSIASWRWTFGEGTSSSTVQSPSYTFGAAGTYTVALTVTDDKGATGVVTKSVTVSATNVAPVASFSANCNSLSCSFTDASTDPDGSIVKWVWEFGDGSTLTNQSSSHTYPATGTYSVSLTVTDNLGSTNKSTRQVTVAAGNTAPTATFSLSCTNATCAFTDSSRDSDGAIATWRWDFGDGTSATAQNPTHTFQSAGTYLVRLDVTDNAGAAGTASRSVTVTASPIKLTATPFKTKGTNQVDLTWSGAAGANVILYRNGVVLLQTPNDGRQTDSMKNTSRADYVYRVCEVGGAVCSPDVTVQFR